nr:uncharacterized protein LOC126538749 [Dermacentor andersoni]XP_054930917.1 uncharacterized protein LOC126538749 [Dermacentor andersoni]XP_054930918.1 uncharacterized protein LOC126538749 [Dermacentor andersoni]XP_054930919.1 uncharacterized protein LOC126538749 [Dermacentor andersoni]
MFSCPACATSFVLVTLLRHNSAKRFTCRKFSRTIMPYVNNTLASLFTWDQKPLKNPSWTAQTKTQVLCFCFEGTNIVMFSCRMCAMSFAFVTLLRPDGVNPSMPHIGAYEDCDNCSCVHSYETSCVVNRYPECWCYHGKYRRTPVGDCVAKNDCIASPLV